MKNKTNTAPAPSLRHLLDTMSGAPDLSGFDKSAAPAPACKCDLRTKLVGDGCEICNPELAKELAAPAPAFLPPLPRLTGLLDEVFSATGLMEKAAFNDYVRSYARAAVEQIVRERDKWKDEHYFQACLTRDLMPYQERAERAEQALAQSDSFLNASQEALERAEREAAEYKRDAERYRWLRTRNEGQDGDPDGPYAVNSSMDGYEPDYPTGDELDAAIDAAKEGK